VQTDIMYCRLGYTSLMYAIASRSGARVPRPSGTMSTSRSGGGAAKVWVGTIDSEKVEFKAFATRGAVETGSRVDAMMERLSVNLDDIELSTSSGPNTSRTWNVGKTIMPYRTGRGVANNRKSLRHYERT
jgi:hypothetical protein